MTNNNSHTNAEHSTWNPIIHIDRYRIVDDQQIPDYENIFMAAYLIGQENYFDQLSSQSNYELLDTNNNNSDVDTLIRQFQSKSNNNNNINNNTNNSNNNNNHLQLINNGHFTLETIWERYLLLNNIRKRLLYRKQKIINKDNNLNESTLIVNNKQKKISILYPTNKINNNNNNNNNETLENDSFKKFKQSELIFNELSLDRYTQKCVEGLQRIDLKCEKLEYMMKSMKDTLTLQMTTYQNHKKKVDNEIMKKCKNFPMKEFRDISKENTLSSDVAKQFTNSLKTILGRKRYFQIIKTSHLENLYNQMNVSQCLAQTTFKQWKKLKEEKHKIELHTECIRLNKTNKMHHNLWKYDIPDILKRIELEVNDFENALKNIDKRLKIGSGNFKITDILEIFTGWYLDISLFIILAALAERFNGLESIIGNNVHKIGTQSLCLKIRKARELFILIGGLDRKQYFQLSYIFQPILKLNNDEITNDKNTSHDNLSSFGSYNKSNFQKSKPFGHIEMNDLKVFFHAANISQVHIQQLITFLDNKNNGTIDFVTFLEYLPLFVESHQQIIDNPYLNRNIFNI
ncbi:unnamed protein product [Schistosoma spindalis]|nr:unnamed protein product [Schistosoma spindale]